MKTFIAGILLFFTFLNLSSQCTTGFEPECRCATAEVLCSAVELNGYTNALTTFQHPQDGPTPFCGNFTQTNNPSWFAFIAWCTDITMDVSLSNCSTVGTTSGGQAVVFSDCNYTQNIACVSLCTGSGGVMNLNLNNLNIGQVYYFMIDGCAGAVCDYSISVSPTDCDEFIEEWSAGFDLPSPACADLFESTTYFVDDLLGATDYHWFIDGVEVEITNGNSFTTTWNTEGVYELCVDVSNSCIDITENPNQICVDILVSDPDAGFIEIESSILCPGDQTPVNVLNYNDSPNYEEYLIITDGSGVVVDILSHPNLNDQIGSASCQTFTIYSLNFSTISSIPVPVVGQVYLGTPCEELCCNEKFSLVFFEDLEAPEIVDPPSDANIPCLSELPEMEELEAIDNCKNNLQVLQVQEVNASPCAGGSVTRTWSVVDDCENETIHTQTLNVEAVPLAFFISTPEDITVQCGNEPTEFDNLFYLNGYEACAIEGQSIPNVTYELDDCGGQVLVTWMYTDFCNREISFTQTITVLPPNEPQWINAPANMSIDCTADEPSPYPLMYDNFEDGTCEISGMVMPMVESSTDDIVFTWEFTNACTDSTISHQQIFYCDCPEVISPIFEPLPAICFGDDIPTLNVQVESGFSANWYDNPTSGSLLAEDTTSYTPTITGPSNYTFYVSSYDLENPNCISQRIEVSLQVLDTPDYEDVFVQMCDDGSDGQVTWELLDLLGVIPTDAGHTLFFYASLSNAENELDEVIFPYINETPDLDTLYVLAEDEASCKSIFQLHLSVLKKPELIVQVENEVCIDANNGNIVISNFGDDIDYLFDQIPISNDSILGLGSGDFQLIGIDTSGCSDTLDISLTEGFEIVIQGFEMDCNDNQTTTLGEDDFYEFSILVSNNNNNLGTYSLLDSASNSLILSNATYGETNQFSLPATSDVLGIIILDELTECSISQFGGTLIPCSTDCEIFVSDYTEFCNQNGTPANQNDDFYQISFMVGAINGSTTNMYEVLVDGSLIDTFFYNTTTNLSIPADFSVHTISVQDIEEASCRQNITTEILENCVECVQTLMIDCDTLTLSCKMPMIRCEAVASENAQYEWSGPNGYNATGGQVNITDPGLYRVTATFSEICNLSQEIQVLLNNDTPEAIVSDDQIIDCSNTSAILDASNSVFTPNANYGWYNENGALISSNIVVDVFQEGEYYFEMIDTVSGCASIRAETVITKDTLMPVAEVFFNTIILDCETTEVLLFVNEEPDLRYQWTMGLDTTEDVSLLVFEEGVIELLVTDLSNGCSDSVSVMVENNVEYPDAQIRIEGKNDCDGIDLCLMPDFEVSDDYEFNWYDENNVLLENNEFLCVQQGGLYFLELINTINACLSRDSILLEEFIVPTVSLPSVLTVNPLDSIAVIAQVNIPLDQVESIEWQPEELFSCQNCLQNSFSGEIDEDTIYVTVTSFSGCASITSALLIKELLPRIYVPTGFNPNSSTGNSNFTLFANDDVLLISNMRIYDRWGELIFEAKDIPPNDPSFGWDGRLGAELAVQGVYVYVFDVELADGNSEQTVGSVSLIY